MFFGRKVDSSMAIKGDNMDRMIWVSLFACFVSSFLSGGYPFRSSKGKPTENHPFHGGSLKNTHPWIHDYCIIGKTLDTHNHGIELWYTVYVPGTPYGCFFFGQTPVFGPICPYGHYFSVICVNHPYETHIFSTCC